MFNHLSNLLARRSWIQLVTKVGAHDRSSDHEFGKYKCVMYVTLL